MKSLSRNLALAGAALSLLTGTQLVLAQDAKAPDATAPAPTQRQRGNFDPAQFRQRMMDSLRERFEVKDDAEWMIISERIEKVFTLRREAGGGFGGRGGGRPPGGDTAATGTDAAPRQRGGFRGDSSPEGEALQKAIEANASADVIKAKLTALRESRKAKEALLESAQEDLRKVLSAKQEAVAVLMGLLK